jgi:hypothetical protein
MQYALLIHNQPGIEEALPEPERAAAYAEYLALADDPRCIEAAQLQPVETVTSVRVAGSRTLVTDGSFADSKEVLGGFCLRTMMTNNPIRSERWPDSVCAARRMGIGWSRRSRRRARTRSSRRCASRRTLSPENAIIASRSMRIPAVHSQ